MGSFVACSDALVTGSLLRAPAVRYKGVLMPRRFNIAGSCDPALHSMIPAERRLLEAPGLVEQGAYFVVHAPRQTGKTTALQMLARQLTASGRYAALHSCEEGGAYGDNFGSAQRAILRDLMLGPRWTSPLISARLRSFRLDDLQYARDLSLCAPNNPVRVANPVYH